jgi:ubiquinone/menaquinone biosynthesis C-methylase UbiE
MANALHYVKDKPVFLEKVKRYLKHEGKMVIVEYDTDQSNQWIPYPLAFKAFRQTFAKQGFKHMHKVGERPSLYRSEKMYAAIAER